uniref:Uncharacterized protein n=1 Tax=Haptolina brevifila TaxID=156173 RepID=A0A7S2I2Z7_9EUKA|mmetsp:Transcript_60807/g.120373  ORF Transcript_60807/g.120373 Transcript_60807/m.120373 type:complete len:576 (+) Transcript_60807:20-1747(+)|eukprot:CAMPEP_0174703614 /NCGR_PEP_ID=MMETSP1094-20130205/7500_1 /TAXON_ID=156173 /ORGANISM="Chrysochromulina brevifilum, Strain UTEX LB 985" /LENGTH=575 /DNA_ID=CAMNT_0015901559 /DNA_START=13 /DNA_END=1740 /DNA_ORIENTATION=+
MRSDYLVRNLGAPTFEQCVWRTEPVATGWPTLSVVYYKNNEVYDQYTGDDYTPYIEFPPDSLKVMLNNRDDAGHQAYIPLALERLNKVPRTLFYSFCAMPLADGSTWHVQRIGPFASQGNYSWLALSGRDAAKLAEKTASGPLLILQHVNSAVDAIGGIISNPPMHMHHIHLQHRQEDGYPGDVPLPGPFLFNRPKQLVVERHAESAYCLDGAPCHPEGEENGHGRGVDRSLDFDSEINDVRAPGSAPLQHWYQIAIRWRYATPSGPRPVTMIRMGMAGPQGVRASETEGLQWGLTQPGQRSLGAYAWIPSNGPKVTWTWQTYITADYVGRVLYIKHHDHMNLMQKNFFCYGPISNEPWRPCGLSGDVSVLKNQMTGLGNDPNNPTGAPIDMAFFKFPYTVTPQLNIAGSWLLPLQATGYSSFDALDASLDSSMIMCTSTRRHYSDTTGITTCRDDLYLEEGFQFHELLFVEYPPEPFLEPFNGNTRPKYLPLHSGWFLGIDRPNATKSCYVLGGETASDKTCTGLIVGPGANGGLGRYIVAGVGLTMFLLMGLYVYFHQPPPRTKSVGGVVEII